MKIKCPTCGKVLNVQDNGNAVNPNALFKCPVCQERHKLSECQQVMVTPPVAVGDKTQVGPSYGGSETRVGPVNGGQTQIGGVTPPPYGGGEITQPMSLGCLIDRAGNHYDLKMGENTVGRDAQTSTAMIKLKKLGPDYDYMSRNHIIIEVKQAGGQMQHILKNSANRNSTSRNGNVLNQTAVIYLADNDILTLGKTDITFKK